MYCVMYMLYGYYCIDGNKSGKDNVLLNYISGMNSSHGNEAHTATKTEIFHLWCTYLINIVSIPLAMVLYSA